ncbi:hypothetical protein [Nonomuraea sp. NPDC050310]|uniref:hypothetical protein n=1 Tax=Nonomuraea sp. NPDC050310 TaxID=3154935 RepID=UPI0033FECAED
MALPSWAPTLEHVADHIPTRTRDRNAPGSDVLLMTFTASTTPTDEQAWRYIAGAVAWTLAGIGGVLSATPLHLADLATRTAALRAAADIELAYPDRNADVSVYEQLNQRAKDALKVLVDGCNDAGGGTEGNLVPIYSFPDPALYGDYPL